MQLETSNWNQNVGNFILYKKGHDCIIKILSGYGAVTSQRQHTFADYICRPWGYLG